MENDLEKNGGDAAEEVVGIRDALGKCARFGIRPGLDSIRAACSAMGNPQEGLRVIHVAGTNGKGAVCALIDSALRAAGFCTGRYTSPHLVALNERFFIDGAPVPDDRLDAAFTSVRNADDLTYFELLTATAFALYRQEKVDYLVLETGLGGRFDATNVVAKPELTVITRIGLDHCDWLGHTIAEIAAEKGGIIKAGVPCVLGAMPDEARSVLESIAAAHGSRCVYAPSLPDSAECGLTEAIGSLALGGRFNRENATTAYAALKEIGIADEAIRRGFASVVWPGRYQRVEKWGKRFLVDGAHNPPAMRALVDSLKREDPSHGGFRFSGNVICGFCGDKDVSASLEILREVAHSGFAVPIRNPRSLTPDRTAELMQDAGFDEVRVFPDLAHALASAPDGTLVCGSLFLAGETLESLGALSGSSVGFTPNESL